MQFRSKYAHARYVMVPDDYEQIGRRTRKVKGMAATFEAHLWDSEQAQKTELWTEQEREDMEQYLLHHEDYDRTLWALSAEDMEDAIAAANRPSSCLFTRTIDGEVWLCGEPAVSDDGYCERHATEINDSPQHKPNRRQTTPA